LPRRVVERQQHLAILGQAIGCLVVLCLILGEEAAEGLFGAGAALGHPDPNREKPSRTFARVLDGQNQLPKVIEGVKFTDGIEANRNRAAA
jgi:hypothetical protein